MIRLFLSLLSVISITFFLMKAIPGDPFLNEQVSQEVYLSLRSHYGLDQPLLVQYVKTLKECFTFNFGPSLTYPCSVNQIIAEGFPVSFRIGIQALLISSPLGIFLGGFAALKQARWQDRTILLFSVFGISVPSFILASLNLFPALALALLPAAFLARLTRAHLIEILKQDYILFAKAKGLSPWHIIWNHALRNTVGPICSYLGPLSAKIFLGSFAIERIFALPGLGMWLTQAISHRDYPVIMGIVVFSSMVLLLMVFLSEKLRSYFDPCI